MAVFSQIKNFIKSGKSYSSTRSRSSSVTSRKSKYETAQRIVEEENMAKQTMPNYVGLEDYQLLIKLGDGAFSKVYQALKLSTNEKVAIKVVHKSELNQQQKASVLKEVQIMRTLCHHAIVKLLDFKETEEHYFLILELCEGGEIFHQIVRLTYLSEELSRHVIKQVAEGIEYLHEERGVVHRDIKPENLLFVPIEFKERKEPLPPPSEFDEPKEDEGEFTPGVGGGGIGAVKIADFGLSKVVWDQQTMTPCGTVGYTAPEIVKDQRYSKSVDMWALGCVLYTLLCGFPPFYDESIKTLTEKVAKGQYTFLSPWWDDISEEAKDLVGHLLDIDPDTRYTILQFLDHPWMKNKKLKEEARALSPTMEDQTPPSVENTVAKPETEAEAFKRMIQERNRDEQELEEAVPIAYASSGVSSVINSRANSRAASRANSRANSMTSGATTPRRDLFSGVTSMKEVFDVSYAVHRMTEEKQRRKSLRSIPARHSAFMREINGDTSSEEDETSSHEDIADALAKTTLGTKSNKGGTFELKMENSTLLGRRKVPNEDKKVEKKKFVSAMVPIDDISSPPVNMFKHSSQALFQATTQRIPSAMQPNNHIHPVAMSPPKPHSTCEIRKVTNTTDARKKIPSATQPIDD